MRIIEITVVLLTIAFATRCGRSESSESSPVQSHFVRDDDSYDRNTSARSCYSAADATVEQKSCENLWYFARPVRLPENSSELNEDDGEYWFCPNTPKAASLTLEQVSGLLCNFAKDNHYPEHISIRSICGPKPTEFGPYCFGADTAILYD